MRTLDLSLSRPAENLACDEALLDWAEMQQGGETLRFWEPQEYFVVLGYANRASQEVNLDACRAAGVPIYRRISGGGAVLQGPGCLNYNLVLKIEKTEALTSITSTNRFIMQQHAQALSALLNRQVQVQGHTDLTLDGFKFSGNSQRRQRRYLVFHGTFLLDFDLDRIERWLRFPSRQPDYRRGRPHRAFLTNLGLAPETLKRILKETWSVGESLDSGPMGLIDALIREKYSRTEWNMKFA